MSEEKKRRGRPSTKEQVVKTLTKAELSRDYLKERTGKDALKENKVLLWGLHKIKTALREPYEKDYKPPSTFKLSKTVQEKKEKTNKSTKVKEVRRFVIGEDYGVDDLDFLRKESDRIDKALENPKRTPEEDEKLMDEQDAIYDLIEGLEAMKKMQGGRLFKANGIKQVDQGDLESDIDGEEDYDDDEGVGLKRKIKGKAVKQATKARVVKGSEEAKALGKKLAEAKKAKKIAEGWVPKEKPVPKEKKPKGLPYYYIGEVPKGYREATQEEAIINNMIGFWGKYKVDELKYRTYNVLGTMFNEKPDLKTLGASIMGMKRRIQRLLKDEEIYKTKLQSEKHKEKWGKYKIDLLETEEQLKYAKIMLEHYLKLYAIDKGVKYVPPVYKIENQYIPPVKKEEPKEEVFEMPKELTEPIPKIKKATKKQYMFTAEGQDDLILNDTHFDKDFNLNSKTAKKLFDKNIRLDPEFYNNEDKEKYFYSKHSVKGGALSWGTFFKPIGGVYRDMMETVQKLDPEFNGLPLVLQRLIRDIGDLPIQRLIINRNPVQSAVVQLLNTLSFGQFLENVKNQGYDKLFHLQIQGYANGKPFTVEKNEILNAMPDIKPPPQSEQKEVHNIPKGITFKTMIRNCKNYMGANFTTYSAQYNNCQDFALAFLKASKVGDQSDYNFIKQNTVELFEKMGKVSKIADKVVGTYADIKTNLLGSGLGKVENEKIQSILFDKKIFTLAKAKKWLKQHHFKSEVDEKPKHYRFRQFTPKRTDRYITKHITDGIEIILRVDHYIEHI